MVNAIILIGGKSERMGFDKYLMRYHDKPQFEYLYELLSATNIKPFISCNTSQVKKIPEDFRVIVDIYEAIGPMGGLASAIHQDHKTPILLIACDLINLTRASIMKLVDAIDPKYDVITYRKKGSKFKETTITIYNPSSFEDIVIAAKSGDYSLQKVLNKSNVKIIEIEDGRILKNANVPGDL